MNQKELEAYNVGKFGLPGDNKARLWPTRGEYLAWQRGRFGMLIVVVALIPGYGTAIEQNMRFPDLLLPLGGFAIGGFLLGFFMARLSYAIIRGAASVFLRHRLHEPRLGRSRARHLRATVFQGDYRPYQRRGTTR